MNGKITISTYKTLEELSRETGNFLTALAADCIGKKNRFSLVLAGGRTPEKLYKYLADLPPNKVDWQKFYIFWGDERCVRPDNTDSNFLMAHKTLLGKTAIPPAHIFRMHGEDDPGKSARQYEETLRELTAQKVLDKNPATGVPIFDLVLLGIGSDGHTASIFPHSPILKEKDKWVCCTPVAPLAPGVKRLTMTLPLLNQADNIWILAAGPAKKTLINEIVENDHREDYPAGLIRPQGNLRWFVAD